MVRDNTEPIYNLTQSKLESDLYKYLGTGKVSINRQNVTYVVRSIDEIVEVILPLFWLTTVKMK